MSNYGSVEMDLKGKIILTYLLTSCKVTKATCLAYVQLNEYETDPYFLELSHHLTSYCFKIYEGLHRFDRQNCFCFFALKSVPICANLHKYWNNGMSNDGSSIKIIDQSHRD